MSQSTEMTIAEIVKPPTAAEIEQIRKGGAAVVEKKREINKIFRTLEGLEWGNVKGRSLSAETRYALAEFCHITRANPQLHIDVLGGKPYLNAQYYADMLNANPYFIGYRQINISPSVSALLRMQAEEAQRDAKAFEDEPEDAKRFLREAAQLRGEAREIDRQLAEWGAPDNATHVIVTIIQRYAPRAPLAQIVAGEIDGEPFIQEVPECNWAGNGKNDPVGNAEPGKTSRTRSLRRAAVKAFSVWAVNLEKEIEKAERAIEAEWRIVEEDEQQARAALPAATGPQAVRAGAGEPEAANANGARPLPVEGVPVAASSTSAPSPTPVPAAPSPVPASTFDKNDARKRFFATLRDAGIEGDPARKKWASDNGLSESTKDWGEAEYSKANELLVGPERKKVAEGCVMLGTTTDALAQEVLGRAADTLRDYLQLSGAINARLDGGDPELAL